MSDEQMQSLTSAPARTLSDSDFQQAYQDAQPPPPPAPTVLGDVSTGANYALDATNALVGHFRQGMMQRGLPQAVGGVVGSAGGMIGGAWGGLGSIVQQSYNAIASGGATGFDFGKLKNDIVNTAMSTASGGYTMGSEGAAAAPLGELGAIPGAMMAAGQVKQAYQQASQAKTPEDWANAAISTVGAGMGIYGAANAHPMIPDTIGEAVKSKISNVAEDARYNEWKNALNQTKQQTYKSEIAGKDDAKFAASQGVSYVGLPKGGLDAEAIKSQVMPKYQATENVLTDLLKEVPKHISFNEFAQKIHEDIMSSDTLKASGNRDSALGYAASELSKLRNNILGDFQSGRDTEGISPSTDSSGMGDILLRADRFNQLVKRGRWANVSDSSWSTPKINTDSDFMMGSIAKSMIEDASKSMGDDGKVVAGLNNKLGDYAHFLKTLRQSAGKNPTGVRTSKAVAGVFGMLSGTHPLTRAVSAMTAAKLAEVMSDPAVRIDTLNKVMAKLGKTPEGADLISKAQELTKNMRSSRIGRPLLSPPGKSGARINVPPGGFSQEIVPQETPEQMRARNAAQQNAVIAKNTEDSQRFQRQKNARPLSSQVFAQPSSSAPISQSNDAFLQDWIAREEAAQKPLTKAITKKSPPKSR